MKYFVNLEIFKLGTSRRHEAKKSKVKTQMGSRGGTDCDD